MYQAIKDTLPKSKILRVILTIILLAILLTPFLFEGSRALDTAARLCIFIVLVASYDLLIGYTGVVSFAHTLFFGVGAYSVAIGFDNFTPGFGVLLVAVVISVIVSALVAITIGLVSLRVKAIFYAMITLAVASVASVLVSQLYLYTGGEDGMTYKIPRVLTPAFKLMDEKFLGVRITGKIINFYFIFAVSTVLFLIMIRIIASPFGQVLKALRENEFRAEAIGYTTVYYRTAATVISATIATLAGVLMALWLRYTGPESVLSLTIMIDILLMVVIGGMGSLYGAIIGATFLMLARNYLNQLMGSVHEALVDVPFVVELFNPERWLLWLGILFVVMVYFFPQGIVGRLVKGKS
jgi:branched-chain amino acid transport system permease protein